MKTQTERHIMYDFQLCISQDSPEKLAHTVGPGEYKTGRQARDSEKS